MQNLQIDGAKAKKLYAGASPEFKEMLHDSFGEKYFQTKITDRLKTWQDACEIAGVDSAHMIPYKGENRPQEQKAINAFAKLSLIRKVLNEGWEPDWNNSNQYKWYPYFNILSGGFGYNGSYCWYDLSRVGSRLCFKSKDLADYAGIQFLSLYNDLFTL